MPEKRGAQCYVPGCRRRGLRKFGRSDSEGSSDEESEQKRRLPRSFHTFPKNPERRKKWLLQMHREDSQPSKHSRICSDHFKERDMDRTGQTVRIRENAAPTRFKCLSPKFTKRQGRQKRLAAVSNENQKMEKNTQKYTKNSCDLSTQGCFTVEKKPEQGSVFPTKIMATSNDTVFATTHGTIGCSPEIQSKSLTTVRCTSTSSVASVENKVKAAQSVFPIHIIPAFDATKSLVVQVMERQPSTPVLSASTKAVLLNYIKEKENKQEFDDMSSPSGSVLEGRIQTVLDKPISTAPCVSTPSVKPAANSQDITSEMSTRMINASRKGKLEHTYSIESPGVWKQKLYTSLNYISTLNKKLKISQQRSRRLEKQVKKLKSLVKTLKNQALQNSVISDKTVNI